MILDKEMLEYEENYFADKDEKVTRIAEFEFAHMSTKEIEKYAYGKLFDFYYDEHTDGELDNLLESLEDE